MPKKMSIWGVGPTVGTLTLVYGVIVGAATLKWPELFTVQFVRYEYLLTVAAVLLAVSLPIYVITIVPLYKGYYEGKLVTTGAYAVCRHPLYAIWILLIVPAVALLMKSWLFLTAAVFMYVVTRIEVRREEEYLEAQFGRQYLAYKKRVGAIFPALWK